MTKPVFLRPEARLDLEDAAKWYNRQRGGLGYEFLDEVVRGFLNFFRFNRKMFSTCNIVDNISEFFSCILSFYFIC